MVVPHEQGGMWFDWLAGVVAGFMIGTRQVLENHANAGCWTVVIAGVTCELDKALAREFLQHGDKVVVTSRSSKAVKEEEELCAKVQEQSGTISTQEAQMELLGLPRLERPDLRVVGIACDVYKSQEVKMLAAFSVKVVNIWINIAGMNKGFKPLLEFLEEELE